VNTGWSGGAYGTGSRMKLAHTRAMVHAALEGRLAGAKFEADPVFGLEVPTAVPGVPSKVLRPRDTWADGAAYDAAAAKLARMFEDNFEKFADEVSAEVRGAGPA
jgi:phosphoenolpyruvate carboxykinase (ATP)